MRYLHEFKMKTAQAMVCVTRLISKLGGPIIEFLLNNREITEMTNLHTAAVIWCIWI